MLNPGQFERRVAVLGTAALLGVAVLFGTLGYWQLYRTDLSTRAGNPRVLSTYSDPNRGSILDREGNELAVSLPDGTREYRDTALAHVLGYLDARYGSQGAELAFNRVLSGESGAGGWDAAVNAEFRRSAAKGLDVRLTIAPDVQAAAVQALGGRTGAVVALDPATGEVLAMVSVPAYDPGALSENGEALLDDPTTPLLNRATQGSYPPGSTFKTVTASSVLENGLMTPETIVECPGELVFDGFPVSCQNVPQGVGRYPFKDAFTFSVNAIFGQAGVDLGWPRLIETARRFGFGSAIPFALETAPSQVVSPGAERTIPLLASTAFGQGELLVTPLQMALVVATIANDGVQMRPIIGLGAFDGGELVERLESPSGKRVLSEDVAATMREFLVSVVENGQASGVAIPGVTVGGKTGTAESGSGTSHAWFIAFAPAEAPRVAVAVVVEHGGQGGSVASPIAGQVIRAALGE